MDQLDVSLEAEKSVENTSEEAEVVSFISNGCSCQFGPDKTRCSSSLNKAIITASRQGCLQLARDKLDLVVLANIRAMMSIEQFDVTFSTRRMRTHCQGKVKQLSAST